MLAATLKADTSYPQSIRIANISATGALLFGALLPMEGDCATLVCGKLEISGRVAWRGKQHAGFAFDVLIDPSAVMPKRMDTATCIVKDEREIDFRRPGFRGNQLSPEERQMLEEWRRSESSVSEKSPSV
jgi:hypothetical protein